MNLLTEKTFVMDGLVHLVLNVFENALRAAKRSDRLQHGWGVGTEGRRSRCSIKTTKQFERLLAADVSADPPIPSVINPAKRQFLFGQGINLTHTSALMNRLAVGPVRDCRW